MNNDKDLPLPPLKEDFEFWNCFDAEILRVKLIKERDFIHAEWQAGRVSRWSCGQIVGKFSRQIAEIDLMFTRLNYQPFDLSFPPSVVVPVVKTPVVKIEEKPKKKKKEKINQKDVNFDLFS